MEQVKNANKNIPSTSHISSANDDRDRVYDQDCSAYLAHLGIGVEDDVPCNAPYREDSNSESFYTSGPFFCDHAGGTGGNVWQLAVLMHKGDRKAAARSLHEAAGIPFRQDVEPNALLDRRGRAEDALQKVREHFAIAEGRTPPEVIDYLKGRKITSKTWEGYLAYIPKGGLSTVLSPEEIELTGLQYREEQIVLWYLRDDRPCYYCTRSIHEKAFRKASTDVLQHPIWNVDALYAAKQVVWGEGLFDCLSLIELGYAVAGEITCGVIGAHKAELLQALRWRRKHLPGSEFTICLDNDALTSQGSRPGNEAAERMAAWLWGEGIDEKWVKHVPTSAGKVDINDLHRQGKEAEIHRMLQSAKPFSDIFAGDVAQCQENFVRCIAEGDLRTALRMLEVIQADEQGSKKNGLAAIASRCLQFRIPYDRVYRNIKLFLHGEGVYVFYPAGRYGQDQKRYDVYTRTTAVDNLRSFQRNAATDVKWSMLDVPAKRPIWRVTRIPHEETTATFNLFEPGWMLTQRPVPNAPLPARWKELLENLAGPKEMEWLLNHMATYVQTLEKPRTIPVFVGPQGTGKNTLAEFFGRAIGGYASVGRGELESSFNSYLRNAVLLLDELSSSNGDANSIKNKLKALVNETASVNEKYEPLTTLCLNNYIAIASNEQVSSVPVIIEDSDRRYTFITGGKDLNLQSVAGFDREKLLEELPDFMLHLLSRDIDPAKANKPLQNRAKEKFKLLGEDPVVAAFRDWCDEHRGGSERSIRVTEILNDLHKSARLRAPVSAAKAGRILESLGYRVARKGNQNHCFGVTFIGSLCGTGAADDSWKFGEDQGTETSQSSPETAAFQAAPGESTAGDQSSQSPSDVSILSGIRGQEADLNSPGPGSPPQKCPPRALNSGSSSENGGVQGLPITDFRTLKPRPRNRLGSKGTLGTSSKKVQKGGETSKP